MFSFSNKEIKGTLDKMYPGRVDSFYRGSGLYVSVMFINGDRLNVSEELFKSNYFINLR